MDKLNAIVNEKVSVAIDNVILDLYPINLSDILYLLNLQKAKLKQDLKEAGMQGKELINALKEINKMNIEEIDFEDLETVLELFLKKVRETNKAINIDELRRKINLNNLKPIADYIMASFIKEENEEEKKDTP